MRLIALLLAAMTTATGCVLDERDRSTITFDELPLIDEPWRDGLRWPKPRPPACRPQPIRHDHVSLRDKPSIWFEDDGRPRPVPMPVHPPRYHVPQDLVRNERPNHLDPNPPPYNPRPPRGDGLLT
jgi:hypothetical protein